MLIQSDKIRPPPGARPDFEALAKHAQQIAIPNKWIQIPTSTITLGMNDPENDQGPERYFGWDNEKPQRSIEVPALEAQARPLTNEDYARFLEQTGNDSIPASWSFLGGSETRQRVTGNSSSHHSIYLNGASPSLTSAYLKGKAVRTVYGPVPLEYALHWPVFASYDELARCATWMNGRIPTANEARSIYNFVDTNKNKHLNSITTKKVSAVNGHLSNDGVEISPPSNPLRKGAVGAKQGLDPKELFVDLEGHNVGFKNFCPVGVTQNGDRLTGQGGMGGVWEWTSSVLERWEGFEAMGLYPAYTGKPILS